MLRSSSPTSTRTPTGARRTRASSATAPIKFGRLLERARTPGLRPRRHRSPRACRSRSTARWRLRRGVDRGEGPVVRALHARPRASSRARCFPVGELTKAEVRAHARRLGLRTAAKPESMDVCFITRGGRAQFLESRLGARARRRRRHRGRGGWVTTWRRRVHGRVSAAASASRPVSVATSSMSTRRPPPSPSGRGPTCCVTRCSVRDLTFVDQPPGPTEQVARAGARAR